MTAPKDTRQPKRWSAAVTRDSDALDIEKGIFSARSPAKIAASLKRSAAPQVEPVPLGDVDADILPQSRGQQPQPLPAEDP